MRGVVINIHIDIADCACALSIHHAFLRYAPDVHGSSDSLSLFLRRRDWRTRLVMIVCCHGVIEQWNLLVMNLHNNCITKQDYSLIMTHQLLLVVLRHNIIILCV